MTRFNTKIGAIVLVLLAGSYMALGEGHTARGEIPVDLTAHKLEHGIDVWKTAALREQAKEDYRRLWVIR